MAVLSTTSMVARLATSSEIAEYRSHVRLNKRIPGYRPKVGFGLHRGWAIEGAIGTEFKIDASYLSPHVNMAAMLESQTRYYGAQVLLSDEVVNTLTEDIKDECRLIDKADLSGSGTGMNIYTIDLDEDALDVDALHDAPITKAAKFKVRFERQRRKAERWGDDFPLHLMFDDDPSLKVMRERYTEEFFCKYKMAYLNYEAGNWPIAGIMLEETRYLLGIEDGASCALLRLLQLHDNVAPKDWQGYRRFGEEAKQPLIGDDEVEGLSPEPPSPTRISEPSSPGNSPSRSSEHHIS